MVKRIIFDVDYTLLKPNYDVEYLFLQKQVDKDNDYFIHHMGEILRVYETVNFKYELVVLSNWIREAQIKKLENAGLLNFFSEVHGGDSGLKPFYQSYMQVIGNHSPNECMMIGDNLALDVIGALNAGLQAIHYTNGKEVEHNYPKVKCLSELKNLL